MPRAGSAANARTLIVLIIVAAVALPEAALSQGAFQVRFSVDRSAAGPVRVNGTVTNEGRLDAVDVYVTAEAVDAAGKIVGRGIAFVSESIPGRGTAAFIVSLPAVPTATRFRVNVSSFRSGPGVQAS
jgi:hypothetical protein